MPLDWDVKKNGVSIRDKVSQFEIRASQGAYARELTLYVKDPSFYDDLDFTSVPESPIIEVLTKTSDDWVSQGHFYVEKPVISARKDSTVVDGIWGRSSTAVLGEPFADRISKAWDSDTSFYGIVQEVLEGTAISVQFDVPDYMVYANSYQVQLKYPIEIISELAGFAGAYISTDASGQLVIKRTVFHPVSHDVEITDADIKSLDERVEFPKFGNRIKIGTAGKGAGLSISLHALGSSDCLPPDSSVTGVLLAQVTNPDGSPADDNLIVEWEAEEGITLTEEKTATGTYTLEDQVHKAQNYYQVRVDFPISDVVGVWRYNDAGHLDNLYNPVVDSFSGRTITFFEPLDYCDQQLRITYKTSGVAVNRITPGTTPKDVIVKASISGATSKITVKIGNPCACGSTLNMRVTPSSGTVCLGLAAGILVWGEINSLPATGEVRIRIKEGCGELSSKNKKFKSVVIKNEKANVKNIVRGVSQVECDITPADSPAPEVYLSTDTAKANDLYDSHNGKVIDLKEVLETDTEVVIDYTALGATAVNWMTGSESSECEAIIEASMEDGHEAGLHATVRVNTRDCTVPTTPPDENEETSPYDPDGWDNDAGDSDGFDFDLGKPVEKGSHAMVGGECGPEYTKRNRKITGTEPESDVNKKRFDVMSVADCPPCDCETLCESEITAFGNTQKYTKTISEMAIEQGYAKGTQGYYEAMGQLHEQHKQECVDDCNEAQQSVCGCTIIGPDAATKPGSYQYSVDLDGPVTWSVSGTGVSIDQNGLVTLSDQACGTYTVSAQSKVGGATCQSKDVRVTNAGHWEQVSACSHSQWGSYGTVSNTVISGKYRYSCFWGVCLDPNGECWGGAYDPCPGECGEPNTSLKFCTAAEHPGCGDPPSDGPASVTKDQWVC